MKDPEKSRADSAAQSRESYKNDLENSRNDSAAQSRESYLKVPEKRRAWNCESYMKDPEKSCWQCSTKLRKLTRKIWRRVVMIVLHGAMRVTWRSLRNVVHETAKANKKDLEKSRWNETGLNGYILQK